MLKNNTDIINDDQVATILDTIKVMFPNAGCELIYHNIFELSVATILSAQTTDRKVNIVTKELFKQYPTPRMLGDANYNDVYETIKILGLANNKAKNIINFSKLVDEKYNSIVPNDFDVLQTLPGVGRKTANVILVEGYKIPRLPVDTHVERVSKRLGICKLDDSVLKVEETLMRLIPTTRYHEAHHLLLFFGRYHCLARNPHCDQCFYQDKCQYKNTPY